MIKSVKFCVNHASRIRKLDLPNARLGFEPGYNAIIGPNGSGKSTVLKALASCGFCKIHKASNDEIKYVTTETLNPLVGEGFSSREAMVQAIRSMFLSHGKGVFDSLRRQSHRSETVMLLDSPETGQDMENCEYIHKGLLKMSERYQVIVATNSLIFVRGAHVIDLGANYLSRLVDATGKLAEEFGFHC
jgi:predicted ATPase